MLAMISDGGHAVSGLDLSRNRGRYRGGNAVQKCVQFAHRAKARRKSNPTISEVGCRRREMFELKTDAITTVLIAATLELENAIAINSTHSRASSSRLV
jgi:hypothetical protein